MSRLHRRVLATATLAALAAPPGAGAQPLPGRTLYDRLPLSTPEEAVATFVEAYRRGDYLAVYFILARPAQRALFEALSAFQFDRLFRRPAGAGLDLSRAFPPMVAWEHEDFGWLFDRVMVYAAARDILPLRPEDLDGPVRLTGKAADGTMGAEAGRGVAFRLETSPAGRWRVLGAFAAGTDPSRPPWGR